MVRGGGAGRSDGRGSWGLTFTVLGEYVLLTLATRPYGSRYSPQYTLNFQQSGIVRGSRAVVSISSPYINRLLLKIPSKTARASSASPITQKPQEPMKSNPTAPARSRPPTQRGSPCT